MSKEINFESLNIPDYQVEMLKNHIKSAEVFVFPKDPGISKSLEWLKSNLFSNLPNEDAKVLFDIVISNKPNEQVDYLEAGFDSCQSHRKLSKIAGEAILLGGIVQESRILGLNCGLDDAKMIANSTLTLDPDIENNLTYIADQYGAEQDFLFPGVTPTNDQTPNLPDYAYQTLKGKPATSVRSLTGLGGFRNDKDWNYVTDLITFADLKVAEDKRYYPGLPTFYFLNEFSKDESMKIPLIDELNAKDRAEIKNFIFSLNKVKKESIQGVGVLCSAYIPTWEEMKKYLQYDNFEEGLDLSDAFHSPAYEFSLFKHVFAKLDHVGELDSTDHMQLKALSKKINHLWSFNSSIHLPWTSKLAGLSNNLMGQITNYSGDYAIKYGVGYEGKSLEIREYVLGQSRKYQTLVAGGKLYSVSIYNYSDSFEGKSEHYPLATDSKFIKEIKSEGFLKATLTKLKNTDYE